MRGIDIPVRRRKANPPEATNCRLGRAGAGADDKESAWLTLHQPAQLKRAASSRSILPEWTFRGRQRNRGTMRLGKSSHQQKVHLGKVDLP